MPRTSKAQPRVGAKRPKPKKPVQPAAKTGMKSAAALAVTAANDPLTDDREEQLDLEDLIGAPVPDARVLEIATARGPGRPVGARNKRTIEWAEYLLTRYASPLEVLAQMAVARVDELAAKLGCTKLEAFQEKRLAAIALVPFIHQKQPLAVNLNSKTFVHLTIVEEEARAEPDELTLTARIVESIDGPAS